MAQLRAQLGDRDLLGAAGGNSLALRDTRAYVPVSAGVRVRVCGKGTCWGRREGGNSLALRDTRAGEL